jgi:Tfp pilus assembly protein PilN
MRELEFLPEWYPKVRQRRQRVALQAWITLILICGLGLWVILVQRNVQARAIELSGLRTDLNHSESDLQRLEDLLQLQRQLGQQDQIFAKIGRPIEATRIITTLEQMMPKEMALLDLSVDTADAPKAAATGSLASRARKEVKETEQQLRFKVHGVSPTDVDLAEFLAKLTGKPFFKDVELTYSHERQESAHVMREFEVTFIMDLAGVGGSK